MSRFNLSNEHAFTADMGELIPMRCQEVLPGDKIVGSSRAFIRMMPQLAPFFTRLRVSIFHFFVPTRLVWDSWEAFITGGPTNDPANEPQMPYTECGTGDPPVGGLLNHMGIPKGFGDVETKRISVLPIRAYQLIWNEWFRDQDLQNPATVLKTSGADPTTARDLQRATWHKDYFRAARPWAQKGPAITMPLGTSAPVILDPTTQGDPQEIRLAADHSLFPNSDIHSDGSSHLDNSPGGENIVLDPAGTLITDLSNATPVTVNALRRALAYQRFSENRARYGSRYTEYLRAMGVISPDERIQRPELLSRGEQILQTSEVLQTGTTSQDPDGVGTMYGHTIGVARSNSFKRYFPEHGYVISLMVCRPEAVYQQGVHRMWLREHKEDVWQPELQHIGSQVITRKEIYALGNVASDAVEFGFIDPYDDYRYHPSYLSGKFVDGENLDHWSLARAFASAPSLNADFVKCEPSKRIFPVTNQPVLYVQAQNKFIAKRLMVPVGTSLTL